MSYSPWDHKELDTAELAHACTCVRVHTHTRAHTHRHTHTHTHTRMKANELSAFSLLDGVEIKNLGSHSKPPPLNHIREFHKSLFGS